MTSAAALAVDSCGAQAGARGDDDRALMARVLRALDRHSFRFANEAQLHNGIAQVLRVEGIGFEHEDVAGARDRFDFRCGRVVVEVKVKGSLSAALSQVARYARREDVGGVILASTCRWASSPALGAELQVSGVPIRVIKLKSTAF